MNETRWTTLTLLAALSLLYGCGEVEETAPVRLRAVRTMVAEPGGGARARTFSGTSKSSQESRLSFKVSGTVDALPIKVGDPLRRGQLIARLDPSLYQLEAQQAEASLVQAEAAERNAAAGYQRVRGLYANNNAARSDLDTARANSESAEAQVRSAEKQLELARLSVSYTRLSAAVDCTVAAVEVEVNENVTAGATVATVNCGSELEVELSIPESLIGGLREGMEAAVTFDALPGETFAGTVTEVGVTARAGATFPATVAIAGEQTQLRSGLAAEVRFEFGGGGAVVFLVPLSALVNDDAGSFVYLAEPASEAGEAVVVRRDVELGELTERGVEVRSGLNPGERVITAGTSVVREGLRVLIEDPAA